MVSLLLLSMALSAPVASVGSPALPGDTLGVELPTLVAMNAGLPQQMIEELRVRTSDPLEARPDTDICYKIRAYIFSKGSNPKLVRETTCGPSHAATKKGEGSEPRLVPLIASEDKSQGSLSPR